MNIFELKQQITNNESLISNKKTTL